jgi:glycosyltransferase involved in cell wall biosynthesis
MRILMVCSTLHVGGAERVAASLSEHLDPRRFEVTACYLKENGVVGQAMLNAGVNLVPIPGFVPKKLDRLTSLKLRRLVKERGIQLLHTHDMHGFMDAAVCRLTVPSLRHVHTFHFGNYRQREPKYRRMEKVLWRVADAPVAVGHMQAETLNEVLGIPRQRLAVIWNGVDEPQPDIADSVRDAIANEDRPIVASISTLIDQKGLHHLLNAAAQVLRSGRRFLLLMVGNGYLREKLENQARELGIADSVKFLGWVPDAARRALPACDIFIQSSLCEAMSIAVLEAMAASKPMVITSVGDNARVIDHEQTGLVVPPADPAALAASLTRLLDEPDLRARLAQRARQRFVERFTVKQMVSEYEALYARLLGRET